MFGVFEKKAKHRINNIFDNETENKILKFWPALADIALPNVLLSDLSWNKGGTRYQVPNIFFKKTCCTNYLFEVMFNLWAETKIHKK